MVRVEHLSVIATPSEARRKQSCLFPFKEIASHPLDARNDKKHLIFKWLYQLLDFYRYFPEIQHNLIFIA
ncbi:hypothetical protein JCM13991_08520 [Thermodesulfovibrio hydrogeniphilus]